MIKMLLWSDYCCTTGFGSVAKNITKNLQATGDFEIDVVGINYDGDPYDTNEWVGNVYPAMRGRFSQGPYMDVFGRQRLLDQLGTGKYDVLFMIQDTFVTKDMMKGLEEARKNLGIKIVYYYPIDSEPHPNWIRDVVSRTDYPITYTQYAYEQSLKFDPSLVGKLEVIYHGTNTEEFYPITEDRGGFRSQYFKGLAKDKFVIMNLNRNQPRKDVLRSMLIQKELLDRGANTLLYLHMAGHDVGGDLKDFGDQLGLELGKDYLYPETIGEGFPVPVVNALYNSVDCLLTTTHGEGWGLSITEAMATKLPVVAPDVTSISEILADNRGILVESGKTNHDWYTQGLNDNNRLRPLMNVQAAADAIEKLMSGKTPDIEAAYKWATEQTWSKITKDFERIIRKAADEKAVLAQTQDGQIVKLNREQRRKLEKVK